MRRHRRASIVAAIVLSARGAVTFAGTAPAFADGAQPADPNGYAEVVQFGAHEDHDLYPAPGNVIGNVRSEVASSGAGGGVSPFVQVIKSAVGSTPSPPGHD
jgi:hypothetical protein